MTVYEFGDETKPAIMLLRNPLRAYLTPEPRVSPPFRKN